MVGIILLTLFSLTALIVLHELGHFLLAKKFGVKVEEFGIGYPPRIWGKKIGETLYSINLIPLGGFVRIMGEEKNENNPRSFSTKPLWQRSLIILGGVIVFWIIGFLLLSAVFLVGVQVSANDQRGNYSNAQVEIVSVAPNSPAEKSGLKPLDIIEEVEVNNESIRINSVSRLINIINENKGKSIDVKVKGKEGERTINVIPRISSPRGQGALGIGIAEMVFKKDPFPYNFVDGAKETYRITKEIVVSLGMLIVDLTKRRGMPQGMEPASIVGIFYIFYKAAQVGLIYFVQLVALIAIYLAVFNILPIPALDGGKLLFLTIEGIRKKPVSEKVENVITTFFFFLLIALVIFVTFKYDIPRIINQ